MYQMQRQRRYYRHETSPSHVYRKMEYAPEFNSIVSSIFAEAPEMSDLTRTMPLTHRAFLFQKLLVPKRIWANSGVSYAEGDATTPYISLPETSENELVVDNDIPQCLVYKPHLHRSAAQPIVTWDVPVEAVIEHHESD